METRRIGSLEVSVVGLGCNNFGMAIDEAQTAEVVNAAIDAGVTYFDCADIYGSGKSEVFLGKALGKRRDQIVLATKFGFTGSADEGYQPGSAAWVRKAVERSLGKLGVEHIDHYQLHRPDPDTPIEETLGALDQLVAEGKVREIGCSNFSAEQINEAAETSTAKGLARFVTCQNHYSLFTREPEATGVLAACVEHNVGFVPFFPLESGLLSGKYRRGEELPADSRLAKWGKRGQAFINDERLAVVEQLSAYAAERGHSLLELAMSWLATNPAVATVIAGATRAEQVRANAASVGWAMTAAERADIDRICQGG